MGISKTLIDNSCEELSMKQVLKACLTDESVNILRIATGYWDIPALTLLYTELKAFLEREGTQMQLLLGKDPFVFASQIENPVRKSQKYPEDFIRTDIEDLELKDEHKAAIQLLLDFCTDKENSKIQIRVFRKNENEETQFLHSKCYIFDGKNNGKGIGIVGSSNFTQKGLEGNSELNQLETEVNYVLSIDPIPNHKTHLQWFNEKWGLSEPWNRTFLQQVLEPTKIVKKVKAEKSINQPLTPYELYIRYAQQQIGDLAGTDVDLLKSYLPKHYEQFDFQFDAVQQCTHFLKLHKGFLLADVVGLGKTVVGSLVIKKFLEEDNVRAGRERRVLIVTPPAIKRGWEDTIADFDKNATDKISPYIDYVTTGSIANLLDDEDSELEDVKIEIENQSNEIDSIDSTQNYGLILIDESHNFRNSTTQKYKAIEDVIDKISIQTGVQPYVGLLSATPQNNAPDDLKNQIKFFVRSSVCNDFPNIAGGNWINFFNEKQNEFNAIKHSKTSAEIQTEKMKALAEEIRQKVLNEIVVRRTRTDIREHYADNGLVFPEVNGPKKLIYTMEDELAELFAHTIEAIAYNDNEIPTGDYIHFARYAAILYFKDKSHTDLYEKRNLNVQGITRQLAKIMKILLVKRLESSFSAFLTSLENLQQYTKNMLQMIHHDCVFICPDIDVNAIFRKEDFDFDKVQAKIREKIKQKGGNNREFRAADFTDNYRRELEYDEQLISKLCKKWEKYARENGDPKREVFRESIPQLFNHTTISAEGNEERSKLVIFTEAIDTLDSVTKELTKKGYRVLKISAKNRKEKQDEIRANFDANYPQEKQENKYDVIVTTEVLAEGVNLHRANVILNYDTPWNATRLMQRIGRVNRIGSTAKEVFVYNFFPAANSDKIINLVQYSHAKLQAFHTMFGEDNQIFSTDEVLSDADFSRTIDGEESPIMQHITNLKRFKEQHPDRFDYLKSLEMKNLGGKMSNAENDALVILGFEGGGYENMINEQTEPISFQTMLDKLLCDETAEFSGILDNYDSRIDTAKTNCDLHANRVQTIREIRSNDRTKALQLLNQIRENIQNPTAETNAALNKVQNAVRKSNRTIINYLLKNADRIALPSLFPEEDLQTWITATFSKISETAAKKRGESFVAIAILKK